MSASLEQYKKKNCRYCDSQVGDSFLDLGNLPPANSFLRKEELNTPEFKCPLSLCWCENCKLVQLTHVVPADLMFLNYRYVSSTTKTFQIHFSHYAQTLWTKSGSKPNTLAVDIGSNDGLLVDCYQKAGFVSLGIEPAKNLSEAANKSGRKTINRYFDAACVKEIISQFGKASVISANNVFAHIDDVQSVCRNIDELLTDDGIFVLEFPYLATMVEKMLFDMIYHEHLSYISATSANFLFNRFNLKIFDIDYVPSHGGSLRVFVQKKNGPHKVTTQVNSYLEKELKEGYLSFDIYRKFSDRVRGVKKVIRQFISDIQSNGKTLSGYGAPAKGNTLICFCELTPSEIAYIVDDNPLKQGLYAPGSHIPIVSSSTLEKKPTDYVLIFAWNFAEEIIKKLKPLKETGSRFIVPLPEPAIV